MAGSPARARGPKDIAGVYVYASRLSLELRELSNRDKHDGIQFLVGTYGYFSRVFDPIKTLDDKIDRIFSRFIDKKLTMILFGINGDTYIQYT